MLLYVTVSALFSILLLRLYLKSNITRCKCKTSMVGKVVIVTGANSGIGYHTAYRLADKGAKVILACRSESRGRTAQNKITNETGNPDVIFKKLNLASFESIHDFAKDVIATEDRLDVLINNAGACALENKYTVDGLIEGMQVNHFGPFLLTLLLLPLLKKSRPSRIVNVSSLIYLIGTIDMENINEKKFNRTVLYADSKLCNLVIQQEFARRLVKMDVVVNSMHPGIIFTNILGSANVLFELFFKCLCWLSGRTAEEGAETAVHLAVSEECRNITGKFYIDCKERYVLPKATDPIHANNLWALSENMVKKYL